MNVKCYLFRLQTLRFHGIFCEVVDVLLNQWSVVRRDFCIEIFVCVDNGV